MVSGLYDYFLNVCVKNMATEGFMKPIVPECFEFKEKRGWFDEGREAPPLKNKPLTESLSRGQTFP